jgi:lipoprotein signal peptidase
MSNKNRRLLGIAVLIVLIISGLTMRTKKIDSNLGWTIVLLGALGLLGFLVDWIHSKFKKPK